MRTFLFLVAAFCVATAYGQISNFQYSKKVYAFDMVNSADGKGYNIKLYAERNGVLDSAQSRVTLLPDLKREIFITEFISVLNVISEENSEAEQEEAPDNSEADTTNAADSAGSSRKYQGGRVQNKTATNGDGRIPVVSAAPKDAAQPAENMVEKGEGESDELEKIADEQYDIAIKVMQKAELLKENARLIEMKLNVRDSIIKKMSELQMDDQDTTIVIHIDTTVEYRKHEFNSYLHCDGHAIRSRHHYDEPKSGRLRSVEFSVNDGTISSMVITFQPAVKKNGDSVVYAPVVSVIRRGDLRMTLFYGKEVDTARTWAKGQRMKKANFRNERRALRDKKRTDVKSAKESGKNGKEVRGIRRDYRCSRKSVKKREYYYIFVADILELKSYDTSGTRSFILPRDNVSQNYHLEGDAIKAADPIYIRDRSANSYFNVAMGTDLLGLFGNNNANGKLKTEVNASFNLFRSNARFRMMQTIQPFLIVTNFSREDENIMKMSTGTIATDSLVGLRLMQTNNFNGGISLDLITMRFDGNSNFKLKFTSRHWETPFIYTDTLAKTSRNFNLKSRSYELGAYVSSSVCGGRIKWMYGTSLIDFRMTNDSIRQADAPSLGFNSINREGYLKNYYMPRLVFSNFFELYYSNDPDSYSKLFCKWNYSYQISKLNKGVNYLQVQVGYTTSFSEFLKSLSDKVKKSDGGAQKE